MEDDDDKDIKHNDDDEETKPNFDEENEEDSGDENERMAGLFEDEVHSSGGVAAFLQMAKSKGMLKPQKDAPVQLPISKPQEYVVCMELIIGKIV